MNISYLPAMKDKHGNRYIGVMGQFDDRQKAVEKRFSDFIFYAPYGLTPDGIVEYDSDVGLLNAPVYLKMGPLSCDAAVISGPLFDEAMLEID